MRMHFHVDAHDVGYMPNPDNVATHITIDGAIHDALDRAEEWQDQVAMVAAEDPETPTRGQPHATEPHTYTDELDVIDKQIKEVLDSMSTDEEYTADVARKGLLLVLEDGVSVIELTPCSEDSCDTYREDWID